MKPIDLSGKVAVVTGAATGIGLGTAECLAECGADLMLQYHTTRPKLGELVERCRADGRRVMATQADFAADPGQASRVVDEAVAGLGQVDILVNNAAVTTEGEPLVSLSRRLFEETLAVNVTAPFLASQTAANHMISRGQGGRIINVSSTHSYVSTPGNTAYATSKGAINALTFAAAVALGGHDITVNVVAPGVIWVDRYDQIAAFDETWYRSRIPMGRLGHPVDVAWLISFLASDEASFINGETILVDGGMLKRNPLAR